MSDFKNNSDETGAKGFFKRWGAVRSSGTSGGASSPEKPTGRPVPGSFTRTKLVEGLMGLRIGSTSDDPINIQPPVEKSTNVDARDSSSISLASSTSDRKPYRIGLFEQILSSDNVDLNALRKISWNGVPYEYKTMVWQLLLGYLPTNKSRRETTINRKRKEYVDSIPVYFDITDNERTQQEGETLRQILVDLPRTCPDTPFFHQQIVQKAMERILFIWSIRHPASGYVQGMNDLLTPLFLVSMFPHVVDVMRCDVASIDNQIMMDVEADTYWCLTKLLDNIQDHYTFSQPGLQRMVMRLEDLIRRIDKELHNHFEEESIQFMQFSFRWMNCLLLREMPLRAILRLWDTYLSEERQGFENFHVYVCAVLLNKVYRDKLLNMAFQDILLFLQELPTSEWTEDEVEPILSQAYVLCVHYENSPSHLA